MSHYNKQNNGYNENNVLKYGIAALGIFTGIGLGKRMLKGTLSPSASAAFGVGKSASFKKAGSLTQAGRLFGMPGTTARGGFIKPGMRWLGASGLTGKDRVQKAALRGAGVAAAGYAGSYVNPFTESGTLGGTLGTLGMAAGGAAAYKFTRRGFHSAAMRNARI